MKCDWVRQNILFYVYNELEDDGPRYEVEQHLARCHAMRHGVEGDPQVPRDSVGDASIGADSQLASILTNAIAGSARNDESGQILASSDP